MPSMMLRIPAKVLGSDHLIFIRGVGGGVGGGVEDIFEPGYIFHSRCYPLPTIEFTVS